MCGSSGGGSCGVAQVIVLSRLPVWKAGKRDQWCARAPGLIWVLGRLASGDVMRDGVSRAGGPAIARSSSVVQGRSDLAAGIAGADRKTSGWEDWRAPGLPVRLLRTRRRRRGR